MPAVKDAINIEDPARLLRFLRSRSIIADDESPEFRVLTGGVSNRAVLVKRNCGEDLVLKQALRKLRVQVDWFSAPERIHREAAGLRWLGKIIPGHVPLFLFEDHIQHILCMTAVSQPHQNWKQALLNGDIAEDHARSFGRMLAKIHNAADEDSAIKDAFRERRYFEELRLEPYYRYTASQAPAARAHLERLIIETQQRTVALVHGDYSPKNVLIARDRLVLLDFEVIHFGDPAFDIGFSLTHFLAKALHLAAHRDALLKMARAYWRSYTGSLSPLIGEQVEQPAVDHTLACILARVAGRSPLEYLTSSQRDHFQATALNLIKRGITGVPELIDHFEMSLARIHE